MLIRVISTTSLALTLLLACGDKGPAPGSADAALAEPAVAEPAVAGEQEAAEAAVPEAADPAAPEASPAIAAAPAPATSPIDFGKEAEGQRAPAIPERLECPEGAEETRGVSAIMCRKREGHTVFHGPYIDTKGTTVILSKTMVDGKEHGVTTAYSESGLIRERRSYHEGKKHGPYATYDENGKLSSVTEYRDDGEQGTLTTFNTDGSVRTETRFIDGVRFVDVVPQGF